MSERLRFCVFSEMDGDGGDTISIAEFWKTVRQCKKDRYTLTARDAQEERKSIALDRGEDLEDLEDLEESEAPAPWSQDPAAEETAGEGGTVARALSPRSSVVQAADAFLNEPDIVALEVLEEMLEDEAERRKEEEASAALQQERERAQLEEKAADFAVQVCI